MPTAKRMVKKPVEEKFVPPVAEVVPETPVTESVITEVEEKIDTKEVVEQKPEEKKDAPVSATPVMPESKPTQIKWGLFYAGSLVVVLVAGFSGGLWWGYRQQWGMKTEVPVVVAEATPTPTPAPTPAPVNRGEITINVLNGSGKTGFASEISAEIGEIGYVIGTVGNASSQTGSTMAMTEDLASRSAEIVADLKTLVGEITVIEPLTSGTSTAKLILGSE